MNGEKFSFPSFFFFFFFRESKTYSLIVLLGRSNRYAFVYCHATHLRKGERDDKGIIKAIKSEDPGGFSSRIAKRFAVNFHS